MTTNTGSVIRPGIKVLFFDVFGTCAAQLSAVADEFWRATQEALKADSSTINDKVREKASRMTYEEWYNFGSQWNAAEDPFRRACIAKTGTVDWTAVDEHRINTLPCLLTDLGLVILSDSPNNDTTSSPFSVSITQGSLFTTSKLHHLSRIWHRLPPYPDTNRGLHLLNTRYTTVGLSNTTSPILKSLTSAALMPFAHILTSADFNSYKPNAKVYLSAAAKMGVEPSECAMVAAHLGDLKGAKAVGFFAINVEREDEEKSPELRGEGIPDLTVGAGDGGFVGLARRLGCL